VTEGGLSISSPGLSSCAIDSSAISYGPLQGNKKARVNAAALRRQSVDKKNLVPLTSLFHRPPVSFFFSLSLLFSFILLGSATRGFGTTIFTGLQTDERFSLKPIRFADDSRYIRSCTLSLSLSLSLSRVPTQCNPMQRDTMQQPRKKVAFYTTCYK